MSKSEELEYVDFEVAKEDWTVFKLEDETLLKSRFTVGAILKKKGTVGEYNVNQNLFTVAIVPKNLWGPPATQKYSREDMFRSIEKEDVKFQCVTPDMWNVYRLSDGFTVSIKLELVMVSRTTLFTERGERIYTFNIQPIFKGKRSAKS